MNRQDFCCNSVSLLMQHEEPSFAKITAESRPGASEALAQALQEKVILIS